MTDSLHQLETSVSNTCVCLLTRVLLTDLRSASACDIAQHNLCAVAVSALFPIIILIVNYKKYSYTGTQNNKQQ